MTISNVTIKQVAVDGEQLFKVEWDSVPAGDVVTIEETAPGSETHALFLTSPPVEEFFIEPTTKVDGTTHTYTVGDATPFSTSVSIAYDALSPSQSNLLAEALTYIVDNTTGFRKPSSTGSGVPIYLSGMPHDETNATAMAMYEPGGAPPVADLSGNVPVVERPRIQLISRSTSFATARQNAQTVWDLFYTVRNELFDKVGSTGTTKWYTVEPVHSPVDMGKDESHLHRVSADFQITKEMS